ncbi:uncharacterized protein TNCV_4644711 [Trichonephila clavipes]|nr:uncharacterized protein TNCV_4644711 [Trichonephila clavipes]
MPLSRMENTTFVKPSIIDYHDMGLRTVLQSGRPKNNAYSTPIQVKLFTSALKAFQCNTSIVMAQRKRLDDFLRGRFILRLEGGRTQLEVSEELGITQSVISRLWQRFQDDDNVSRWHSTGLPQVTTPNEDRYIFGSYCQKKQTEYSIRPVSSALFSYQYDSFKTDHVQTLRAHWSICS